MTRAAFPDGIDDANCDSGSRWKGIAVRLSLVGLFLALGLVGLLGGAPTADRHAEGPAAALTVHAPHPIRNGMVAEWRITAEARAPVTDLVVAVPANLWRDMTINSLIPAATEESYEDGEFRYHFGPLAAGKQLLFKVDGQLNPPHFNRQRGAVRLLDGTRELVRVPVDVKVIY